jgi:phosphate transport system permease protein
MDQRASDRIFHVVCALGVVLPLGFGAWFVLDTLVRAWPGLSNPNLHLGLVAALLQSARIVGLALALALPVGIGAAVYLEHLASQRIFTALAQRAITLLAAVPSVLYGLFGLTLFTMVLGVRSMFVTASITLACFLFPVIVERTRAALQTVSPLVHEASLALGADPWRALVHVVLPLALPKLAAELLHLVARALGTAAPLLVVGILAPMPKVALVMPLAVRIFDSVAEPDPTQQTIAAAAIIVLLVMVVLLHVLASWLSKRPTTRARRTVREGLSERGVA